MAVQLAERVSLNPPAEDPTLQSLDFCGYDRSWGIYLLAHDYAPPKPEVIHSSSSDTEGDPVVQAKYGNRTITAKVRVFEPEDPAAVNLVPNPSAELALENISNSGGTAPARVVEPLTTPRPLNLDTFWTGAAAAAGNYGYWDALNLTTGKTYTFSAYVQVTGRTGAAGLKLVLRKAAGAALASSAVALEAVSAEFVRMTVTFAVTESAATYRLCLEQTGAGTIAWSATAAQAEEGAAATHYFDGDTPGCDWAGERNKSTSSRPAPDGTRFSRICRDVTRHIDKIKRTKQGVLRRISAQGGPMFFDLKVGEFTEIPTTIDATRKRAEYGMSYEARWAGRGPEVLLGETEELTKPALSMLVNNVPGETTALGRLVLTDKQGVAQHLALTGVEQTYLSTAATAETFYEAETRTAIGSSSVVEGITGSSGNKCVKSPGLIAKSQTILSTQTSGAGAHLSHIGGFRVFARVKAERGGGVASEIKVKLAWSEGDFVNTNSGAENEAAIGTGEGNRWILMDLGTVNPAQASSGTQRWEGRISATSANVTGTDVIYIDCLCLQPITDSAATMTSNPTPTSSGTFTGYDSFTQTAGALTGKVAVAGGTWGGAGSANDFATIGTEGLKRTAISDAAGVGRYATLGASEPVGLIGSAVSMTLGAFGVVGMRGGLLLRYLNVENWFMATVESTTFETYAGGWVISLRKRVANVTTTLATIPIEHTGNNTKAFRCVFGCTVDGSGNITGTIETFPLFSNGTVQPFSSSDAVLNEAGALKKGKFGLYDEWNPATARERTYGAFEVTTPIVDAAIYANKSLELRSDRARRESADGTTWGGVANEGDYLTIPPSGPEKRPARIFAKGSRNPLSDEGIDDLKAQLFATPQYLHAASY